MESTGTGDGESGGVGSGDLNTGDLSTGDLNTEAANDGVAPADSSAGAAPAGPSTSHESVPSDAVHPDTILAAERLADLQRLNAEYVNYKRRVDRDRPLIQERAIQDVIEAMLPVLDDIQAGRDHGDLVDGPFAAIADKLEGTLGKFGAVRYGAVGETFDPAVHEALMHLDAAAVPGGMPQGASDTTVVQVLQPGYRVGDRVLRPARVAVADPA
ncbi:MAG: nucleotide exchange factor GrpE [Tetrasphaera sp.]|nr:nucleotide exchange factor GrpE [Tetrasphaera sp.]